MKSFGLLFISLALTGTLAAQPQRGPRQGTNGAGPARMDADGDGRISQSEWKGNPEAFRRLDANNDGYISRDEIGHGRGQAQGARGQANLRKLDTNNDGRISGDEWKGPQQAFDRMDSNHDGYITREEMQQNRPEQGRLNRGPNLSQMDADHDGRISKDEWQGPADRFDRIDANHDGYIAQDEMRNRPERGNRQ